MVRERKLRPAQKPIVGQIMEKYHRLPPAMPKIIEGTVDRFWSSSNEAPAPTEEARGACDTRETIETVAHGSTLRLRIPFAASRSLFVAGLLRLACG